jgi:hypothetical protein
MIPQPMPGGYGPVGPGPMHHPIGQNFQRGRGAPRGGPTRGMPRGGPGFS